MNLNYMKNKYCFSFRAKEYFKKKTAKLDIETHYNVSDLTRCIYRRMKKYNMEFIEI